MLGLSLWGERVGLFWALCIHYWSCSAVLPAGGVFVFLRADDLCGP